jgi:hypothetical protein
MAKSKQEAANQCAAAIQLFEALGVLVNYSKSQVQPAQEVTFLGMAIDSKELSLPSQKLVQIKTRARELLKQRFTSTRELAQFIGELSATVMASSPSLPKSAAPQAPGPASCKGYDHLIRMSREAREDLEWWLHNVSTWNGRSLQALSPEWEIETDASRTGWGAFLPGQSHRRSVVRGRDKPSHQRVRAFSGLFHAQGISEACSQYFSTERQCDYSGLHKSSGRNQVLHTCRDCEGTVDMVFSERHSPPGSAPSRKAESPCRFHVSPSKGQDRLDSQPSSVQVHQAAVGSSRNRSFCDQILSSVAQILQLASRS